MKIIEKLKNWKKYKGLRSKNRRFNKLLKTGLSLTKIHRYTKESIHKFLGLNCIFRRINHIQLFSHQERNTTTHRNVKSHTLTI